MVAGIGVLMSFRAKRRRASRWKEPAICDPRPCHVSENPTLTQLHISAHFGALKKKCINRRVRRSRRVVEACARLLRSLYLHTAKPSDAGNVSLTSKGLVFEVNMSSSGATSPTETLSFTRRGSDVDIWHFSQQNSRRVELHSAV